MLKDKGRTVIAVGTIYQTPLNVVDPATGVVIWKTWEQTGSETMSTTEYCGKVLRDMVFLDTDGDGDKEIVFGNESHTVYAMNAADGRVKWKAQVGDKVSVMKLLGEQAAGAGGRIIAATEAGEVYLFDKSGRREAMMSLGSGVTGLEVMSFGPQSREDVLLATDDGRLAVTDAGFVPRGSLDAGIGRLNAVFPAKSGDKDRTLLRRGRPRDRGGAVSALLLTPRGIIDMTTLHARDLPREPDFGGAEGYYPRSQGGIMPRPRRGGREDDEMDRPRKGEREAVPPPS